MKIIFCITIFATAICVNAQPAQTPPRLTPTGLQPAPDNAFSDRMNRIIAAANPNATPEVPPTKFSLDFPGGTPKELMTAIEQALGKSVNVIIPENLAATKLPALKMTDVTVPQLFNALLKNSYKYDGSRSVIGSYGFESEAARPTEESIWQFFMFNAAPEGGDGRFDLDFAGGTPKQLVAAIQKVSGRPLNAVILAEHDNFALPPLKLKSVTVAQLFEALELASIKREAIPGARVGLPYQNFQSTYGFRAKNPAQKDTIWYFTVEKPTPPIPVEEPNICRFYPLESYLERGLTVDDITTAIQTGWKMLGDREPPVINFHKDTKLLIAVGPVARLETIDSVLAALRPSQRSTPAPTPKPAETNKTAN
jgi:hypothetical protein